MKRPEKQEKLKFTNNCPAKKKKKQGTRGNDSKYFHNFIYVRLSKTIIAHFGLQCSSNKIFALFFFSITYSPDNCCMTKCLSRDLIFNRFYILFCRKYQQEMLLLSIKLIDDFNHAT